MNMWFWIRRPRSAIARIRYWLWEKRNPDKPWLTPGSVQFCERALAPPMRGWEFGSGRSTVWFAGRLAHLVSVEHDPTWHAIVQKRLATTNSANVDYRLIPLDHPVDQPEKSVFDPLPRYVAAIAAEPDESLDLVVIDGHYRTNCTRVCLPKLRPGGLLLIDDLNLWACREDLPIPADWPSVHESTNGIKRTGIWRKPASLNV
jgi:Methyltransferase domain